MVRGLFSFTYGRYDLAAEIIEASRFTLCSPTQLDLVGGSFFAISSSYFLSSE